MIKFTDRARIGQVKKTPEGYLVAHSRALRTGVQDYLASELGLVGNHIVKVYRPPESVFDASSLSSMAQKPVTVGHPSVDVTPDNYAELAVGHVTNKFARDGEWVALEVMVTDRKGLNYLDAGNVELSAGYVATMTEAPANSGYDFIMGPPQYNHLAIVSDARAGSEARIGDAATWGAAPINQTGKEAEMAELKAVAVGDKAVQVAASDADTLLKIIKDHADALAEKDAEIAALKVECADATKQIKTDDEIAALVRDGVAELSGVIDKAKALVDGYDATGKDAMTIRREVIKAVYGDEAIADFKTDIEVKAAFAVAKSTVKTDPIRDAIAKGLESKDAWGFVKTKKEGKK